MCAANSQWKGFNDQQHHPTFDSSLNSHHRCHSDSRLHLQSVCKTSGLCPLNPVCLSPCNGCYRIVDVERPCRSTSAFEEIAPVICMRCRAAKSRRWQIQARSPRHSGFRLVRSEPGFGLRGNSSNLPSLLRLGLGLRLRFTLGLEIERHCSADEILQGHLIDVVAFMDVDSAADIPLEAGVE